MTKRALMLLAEGFEDIEAVGVSDLLHRAGIQVTFASLGDLKVKGSRGITVVAGVKLADAGDDFDACILPGGSVGSAHLAASKEVGMLVRKFVAAGKVVAAICAAPAVVLAPLGVLKGKSATCYPGMEEEFGSDIRHGQGPVVVDGNIITSQAVGTTFLFALAIIEKLAGRETAEKVRKAALIG